MATDPKNGSHIIRNMEKNAEILLFMTRLRLKSLRVVSKPQFCAEFKNQFLSCHRRRFWGEMTFLWEILNFEFKKRKKSIL